MEDIIGIALALVVAIGAMLGLYFLLVGVLRQNRKNLSAIFEAHPDIEVDIQQDPKHKEALSWAGDFREHPFEGLQGLDNSGMAAYTELVLWHGLEVRTLEVDLYATPWPKSEAMVVLRGQAPQPLEKASRQGRIPPPLQTDAVATLASKGSLRVDADKILYHWPRQTRTPGQKRQFQQLLGYIDQLLQDLDAHYG